MNTYTNAFADVRTIITHGGGAHRDELLAVAIALALAPKANVERRDPLACEMADPEVLVLDVGMKHDPATLCFDHHQLPRDASPTCALTLLLAHLGLLEAARECFPWLAFTESMDSKGPIVTGKTWGLSQEAALASQSPIEGFVLRMFAKHPSWFCGEPIHDLLLELGRDLLAHIGRFRDRMDKLNRVARVVDVAPGVVGLDASAIPASEQPTLALEAWVKLACPEVAFTITQDARSSGLSLYRRNDHPALDFAQVKNDPRVAFAHANGFLATTRELDLAAGLEVVRLALRK